LDYRVSSRPKKEQYDDTGNYEKDLQRLLITIYPEIVSGMPVFGRTRVPIELLIATWNKGGSRWTAFIENFPTVTREPALQMSEFKL
jgi:uncharacterized protein (DUF433 family)